MDMEITAKDRKFFLPCIIVMLIAAYNISNYIQHEAELKEMRGAEWVTYDAEGRLYFTYYENVYRLSSNSSSLEKFIETGLNISSRDIMDIAIAPSGDIFLTDPTSGEIHVYSDNGILQRRLKGYFRENARIVLDNERIYIADMQGNQTLALDINKGRLLWTDRNYLIPDSLFVRNSVVYVSDENKKQVRLLNAEDGQVIKTIHTDFPGFSFGSSILVFDDDTILLAPSYTHNGSLVRISDDGSLIETISGPNGFTPVDMAISPDGNVIITDDENYSFYNVRNNVAELFKPDSITEFFRDMQAERTSLEKSALTSKLFLTGCVIFLLALYVCYRRSG